MDIMNSINNDLNIYDYEYNNIKYKVQDTNKFISMQVFIENNVYVISTQKTKTKHIMLPIPLNHKYSNILMDVLCDYCKYKNYVIYALLLNNEYDDFLSQYGAIINNIFISK